MEADAGFRVIGSAASVLLILLHKRKLRRKQRKKRLWVKQWIARRKNLGAYHSLLRELALEDVFSYKNCLRMDAAI
eukprot:gene13624-4522_t